MPTSPMVHLVSYATPRFQFRQKLLGLSARWNGVADTTHAWTLAELRASEFPKLAPDIGLNERGSGFWAWKPFIIAERLDQVPDGDIVFYCDVGRLNPFKLLDQPVDPCLSWMDEMDQDVIPGVLNPWDGNVGHWTRRSVLVEFEMDFPEVHEASQVQASFSLWRASDRSRRFARQWRDLCTQRHLVSDDPGPPEHNELARFRAHRHDQALLTLCCMRDGIRALDIGRTCPDFDSRDPSQVSRALFGPLPGHPRPGGKVIRSFAGFCSTIEIQARKWVKFGKPIHE